MTSTRQGIPEQTHYKSGVFNFAFVSVLSSNPAQKSLHSSPCPAARTGCSATPRLASTAASNMLQALQRRAWFPEALLAGGHKDESVRRSWGKRQGRRERKRERERERQGQRPASSHICAEIEHGAGQRSSRMAEWC
jgi:hypothetical protein